MTTYQRYARVIEMTVGLGLLIAGGLKLAGLTGPALPAVGWTAALPVQVAAGMWEVVVGTLLVVGASRPLGWWLGIATFLGFTAVSLQLARQGVARCGCFGAVPASPWQAFAIDVVALILLLTARSGGQRSLGGVRLRAVAGVGLGAVGMLGVAVVGGSLAFGSLTATLAHLRGATVEAPSYLDLGAAPPGQTITNSAAITNWTDNPVRLIGGTSDCTCLTTGELPVTIPAGRTVEIAITLRVPRTTPGRLIRTIEIWTDCDRRRTLRVQLGCLVEAE